MHFGRLVKKSLAGLNRKCDYAENRKNGNQMIIALVHQKGGVGKTTLSINIAGTLAKKGKKVLYVDADPQGSALDWAEARQEPSLFTMVGLPKPVIHKEVVNLSKDYDYVIIDGPPRVSEVTKSILLSSDVAIIPIQPSPYDVWAAKEVIDIIKEAAVYNEKLKIAFAINRKIVNTAIGRDVAAALSEYEAPVLETAIGQRVIFAESATGGRIVAEVDENSVAAKEIADLTSEITNI